MIVLSAGKRPGIVIRTYFFFVQLFVRISRLTHGNPSPNITSFFF